MVNKSYYKSKCTVIWWRPLSVPLSLSSLHWVNSLPVSFHLINPSLAITSSNNPPTASCLSPPFPPLFHSNPARNSVPMLDTTLRRGPQAPGAAMTWESVCRCQRSYWVINLLSMRLSLPPPLHAPLSLPDRILGGDDASSSCNRKCSSHKTSVARIYCSGNRHLGTSP
jgi:hypothetical protein